MWIPTVDCIDGEKQCHSEDKNGQSHLVSDKWFDHNLSTTYRLPFEDKKDVNTAYQLGSVTGHHARDTVCFNQNSKSCIDYDFLSVYNTTSLEGLKFDGVVGLSPSRKEGNTILLDKLKQNGLIDKKVFSLKIGTEMGNQTITFGSFNHLLPRDPMGVLIFEAVEWHSL